MYWCFFSCCIKEKKNTDKPPVLPEKYKTIYKEGKYYVFLSDGACDFIEI